jgi:hypothetical protein
MDTSSIIYNYAITLSLYKSKNFDIIKNEIIKLINSQIQIIQNKYSALGNNEKDIFPIIKKILFKNNVNEAGQVAIPLIRPTKSAALVPVKNVLELKQDYIPKLNIRELMTVVKNFQSSDSSCFMFSIIIEFVEAQKKNKLTEFQSKYPMLNLNYVTDTVILIENILGFDIMEVDKCYNNMNGDEIIKTTKCSPYYEMMQKEFLSDPKSSPITICWLWHALVYGVPFQDVLKLPANNRIKQISTSFKKNTLSIDTCMTDTFQYFPIFPPLSIREKKYMKQDAINVDPLVDNLYERPPWTPPICYMKPIEPISFSLNIQKRYNKFFVSNLSGHVMLFLIISRYFKDINLNLIILASIIYMVPYNHSINEILKAANLVDVNTNYSIKKTDLENINNILTNNGLIPIDKEIVQNEYNVILSKIPKDSPYYPVKKGGRKHKNTKTKMKIKKRKTIRKHK